MKHRLFKRICILSLLCVGLCLAVAAEAEIDLWVSKLFVMPTPTVTQADGTVTVSIQNPGTPTGIPCQIVSALYDGNGRMLAVKPLATDSSENYTFPFASVSGAKYAKVFMLANDGMKPIYEAVSADIPAE